MLNKQDTEEKFKTAGHPKFRAKQLMDAVFKNNIIDAEKITTFSKDLVNFVKDNIKVYSLAIIKCVTSKSSDTTKIVFSTIDNYQIEAVLMKFKDGRNTVCISSQAGCKLGCKFCLTGKMGFFRDLSYEEITDQILFVRNLLAKENTHITNIVFMGMGEPFMNYENVMKAVRFLNDPDTFNIGARNITISTSGIVDGIKKLADENIQVNLAISLHAPNQEIREKIMPVSKIYKLDSLIESLKEYISKTNRRVSFEYVMLNGINDSEENAAELGKLLENLLCHINLIPYNATGIAGIEGSGRKQIDKFVRILENYRIAVTVRVSLGQDIYAACGQLANK